MCPTPDSMTHAPHDKDSLRAAIVNAEEAALLRVHHDYFAHREANAIELAPLYGNPSMPEPPAQPVDFEGRSLDWCVACFTLLLAVGQLDKALHAHLVRVSDTTERPAGLAAAVDYAWFLFSLKKWPILAPFLAETDFSRLGPTLGAHLCDLAMLTFYRQSMPIILAGDDPSAFQRMAHDFLETIMARLGPSKDHIALYRAFIAHIEGDFAGAREQFLLAARTLTPTLAFRAIGSVLSDEAHHPVIKYWQNCEVKRLHQDKAIFLLSVDRHYFDTYFAAFITRLAQTNPNLPLHLHAIGFDPLPGIIALGLENTIGFTVDHTDLSATSPHNRKAYYAGARLLHLPHYLDRYDAVFVSDIDGVIKRPIGDLLADTQEPVLLLGRVVARPQQLFRLPWESIGAGNVLARATSDGRQFAEAVGSYIAKVLSTNDDGRSLWYVDQNALFYVWISLRDKMPIGAMPYGLFKQADDMSAFTRVDHKIRHMRGGS